jgi:hypothetical protein
MWSLPDIKSLNARAAANAATLNREAKSEDKPVCKRCECFGRKHPAEMWFLVYDIFSDDPKSVLHLCDDCVGQSGDPWEGYFTCESCGRVMVENYTWERYQTDLGGASICLKCAAEQHFADKANWIDPAKVKRVVAPSEDDPAPLFTRGILNIRRCKHVLGVGQTPPVGIKFHDNSEFDSCDGHQISGRDLLDVIRDLHEPFCPVLDAAYQFAVSIGIYVRRWPANKPFAGLFTKAGDGRRLPITFSKRYNVPRWAGIALDPGWETGQLRIEGQSLLPVSEEKEAA